MSIIYAVTCEHVDINLSDANIEIVTQMAMTCQVVDARVG
jgi:hypothetical protein